MYSHVKAAAVNFNLSCLAHNHSSCVQQKDYYHNNAKYKKAAYNQHSLYDINDTPIIP